MTYWTPKNLVVKDGQIYQRWVSDHVPPREEFHLVWRALVRSDDGKVRDEPIVRL